MRADLEKLYMHLSDVSIRLSRLKRPDEVSPRQKKTERVNSDDLRVRVAKRLEELHNSRDAYLEQLKEKIARGEYRVSAEEVAKRILGVIDSV
jgi:anti-sigma28 factor (negative regulator of flagellin synthesis)